MAKKTRKVLKQETQQRAIQQAVANVSSAAATPAPAPTPLPVAAPASASKFDVTAEQEFAFVKSDVRKSLTLATVFIAVLIVLSFIIK